MGRTIAIYGDTGSGKTTQIGELAKKVFKETGKRTRYYAADRGGYESIKALESVGVLDTVLYPHNADPWAWSMEVVDPEQDVSDIGLVAYDSGSSMAEMLLTDCKRMAGLGQDIGGRPAPKFKITKSDGTREVLGSNVDSHYMVVQGHMTDVIWRSTWMTPNGGPDVLWSFGLHRGEREDDTSVLGPQLAGKALTGRIPRWFNYTFRLASIPEMNAPPRHVLYLQEQSELGGMGMAFGNSRYPLSAFTALPEFIEPASLSEALTLIENGQREAEEALRNELGL